ncbi:MAG: TetR/AcrR family transcriptional regulator [Nitrospina sp.]|jgi:AcrR family transcriptional regulator|nr:TetR/AcrR family transcriptional regulator [Nitrospina sp.]MBT3508618.1 TetR/AcrR family transcriptional regulator [Nitrospina sp.]MBT3875642.1 TetR/AcrR family transcriptional regulator [Nitrospina sp.]MBT4048521.1 TetR/AcrR family transcriptional regulator [Nitrospina sp.]MBT4558931.1 TetR/AcrR family transcriptional regulator [Nitrospina sp.]
MPRTSDKREKLVESAGKLFHQVGFNQTSIADIAEHSGVPLGNVHYYFKTKADLVSEVLGHRKKSIESWFEELEKITNPKDRLIGMLGEMEEMKHKVVKYGCPVGSLCQELDKERMPVSKQADGLIKIQLKWVTGQFRQMGKKDAEELGLQWMSSIHGTALMANAMKDPKIIDSGIRRLKSWIRKL